MKLNKNAKSVFSSDTYYDLFEGGYIEPKDLLEEPYASEVAKAISTVEQYLDFLRDNNILEEG